MPLLPTGFADLEPFVAEWDLPDFNARRERRSGAGMAALRSFYDAMVPRGPDILALVDGHIYDAMPDDVARLYRLLLALSHVSMAIEVHGVPRAPFAPYPDGLHVTRGFSVVA